MIIHSIMSVSMPSSVTSRLLGRLKQVYDAIHNRVLVLKNLSTVCITNISGCYCVNVCVHVCVHVCFGGSSTGR
jgi:hypothetical protein